VSEAVAPARPVPGAHVPGEPGLWILILGDLTVFAVLFGAFLVDRHGDPRSFAASRHGLTLAAGVANTLILLTGSLLVAQAVQRHRAGDRSAGRLALGAVACGLAFVVVKALEWTHLAVDHHGPGSNTFFRWFFVLTGLHLVHLLLGLAGLIVVRRVTLREEPGQHDRIVVEGVATYWHMVDLLWLVIFPLVYLSAT
jgi:nitric oxide reductase NorE protein